MQEFLASNFPQQLPDFSGILVPSPLDSRLRCGITDLCSQKFIRMELPEHSRKLLKIVKLAKYEPVESVANPLGHAGLPGSNNGQTASHSFRDGQAEGIFAAGADVEISGRIEIENILARRFKTTDIRNAKRFCHFAATCRNISTDRD